MEQMDKNGLDLTKVNIEKLKRIFPECVCDGKINFDMLRLVLGDSVEEATEDYSFNWIGKQNAFNIAKTPSTMTLLPRKDKSVNWDVTQNLYIEGDNLEVLKVLSKTYHNLIKMIYIDPPYNTGNDFIYNDNFYSQSEEYIEESKQNYRSNPNTSGKYHTNWLNMMLPRLKIASEMLADEGVIFISIDDNELCNLKKLCDTIFGENNFIAIFSVENNPKGRKNSKFVSVSSDYCIAYAKDIEKSYFCENIPKNASDLSLDENGRYVHNSGKRVIVGENKFNNKVTDFSSEKHYTVYYNPHNSDIVLKQEKDVKDLDIDLFTAGYERIYSYDGDAFVENTYTKSKFMELVENEAIEVKNGKIYEKNYSTTIRIKSILANREYQAIIDNKEVTHKIDVKTTSAGTYLKDLFDGKDVFSAPKPIGLLELLISLFDDKEMIVMDFFSGSSTTADAVMRMNASDGGNRKFIMVQLSEDLDYNLQHCKSTEKETVRNAIKLCDNIKAEHILPNVAEERIRRAGKKIYTELKDKKNSLDLLTKDVIDSDSLDIGFKVFKLDSTNIRPWDSTKKYNSNNIFDLLDVVKEGRSNLDVAYEVMLKYGVFNMPLEEVQANGKTVYSVGSNYMIISLNDEITSDDVLAIAKLEPKAVVFKESGFKSDNEKLNTEYTFKRLGIDNVKCI